MRTLFTLIVLACSLSVNSQVLTSDKNLYFIPAAFTTSGKSLVYGYDYSGATLDVYDANLQLDRILEIKIANMNSHYYYETAVVDAKSYDAGTLREEDIKWTISGDVIDVINSTGIESFYYYDVDNLQGIDNYVHITQSLFNNDVKFEFIMKKYEGVTKVSSSYIEVIKGRNDGSTYAINGQYLLRRETREIPKFVGYDIVNEDGNVLFSINTKKEVGKNLDVLSLNGKKYLSTGNELYEIDIKTSSAKAVISLKGNNVKKLIGIYDTNGRKNSREKRGVNIMHYSDGSATKVIK